MRNNKTKVNIKARIDRHLRIVKNNSGFGNSILIDNKSLSNFHIYIVLFFLVFIFPFYPTLASFVYNNSTYDFYRGDIDESSILESYYGGDLEETGDTGGPIFETTDSYISVNTILNDDRNVEGTNEIISYEIKPGDSFSVLSNNFNVTINSILWANNFDKNHTLRPGEIIRVPPVSGIIHKIKSGDTISALAQKYDIGESKIRSQNGLSKDDSIKIGQNLVLPGAEKIIPKPKYTAPSKTTYTSNSSSSSSGGYSFANQANSQTVSEKGSYKLVWRKPQHTFYWGNCTRYVAQYKNVNWGGNANQWLRNARAKGHATGSSPRLGSIVQFSGRGYNPRYGHVGIVTEIKSDHIIVSDMNYRKLNEITYRKVPINDRSIDGYIYVN